MATQDTCCTINPYFKVNDGKLEAFKALCEQAVEKTSQVPKCLAHLENVSSLLQELLKISDLTRLEIHGPEAELAKLRGPTADLKPQFFTLEYGFRR